MRIFIRLAVTFLVCTVIFCGVNDNDSLKDDTGIIGTWTGNDLQSGELCTAVFESDSFSLRYLTIDKYYAGTYSINGDVAIHEIDLMVLDGKNIDEDDNVPGNHEGIFKISDDTLWLSFQEPYAGRATGFLPEGPSSSGVMKFNRN